MKGNQYDFGATRVKEGYHAWFLPVYRTVPIYVKNDKGSAMLFRDCKDAMIAGAVAMRDDINSPITSETIQTASPREAAEAWFRRQG